MFLKKTGRATFIFSVQRSQLKTDFTKMQSFRKLYYYEGKFIPMKMGSGREKTGYFPFYLQFKRIYRRFIGKMLHFLS